MAESSPRESLFDDPHERTQKRPWRVEVNDGPAATVVWIRDDEDLAVTTVPDEVDARLIVAAVNTFDARRDVAEALREFTAWFEEKFPSGQNIALPGACLYGIYLHAVKALGGAE